MPSLGSSGQADRERAAAPLLALDRDAAAVSVDDPLGDGEPQADPLAVLAAGLEVPIEDVGHLVGGDAWAGIGDVEARAAALVGLRPHADGPPVAGELDGVSNHVREH